MVSALQQNIKDLSRRKSPNEVYHYSKHNVCCYVVKDSGINLLDALPAPHTNLFPFLYIWNRNFNLTVEPSWAAQTGLHPFQLICCCYDNYMAWRWVPMELVQETSQSCRGFSLCLTGGGVSVGAEYMEVFQHQQAGRAAW